jgi:inorganic pyrophosphatase
MQMSKHTLDRLPTFVRRSHDVHAVIEAPRGGRNKFKYEPDSRCFKLCSVLPAGLAFPFDFGFIPSTVGEDGDPLDVLVLSDDPLCLGCVVDARLIGVIEAEEAKDGETRRNDRLIAVASLSHTFRQIEELNDLDPQFIEEIEKFFVNCHESDAKTVKILGRTNAETALVLVEDGLRNPRERKSA